MSAPTTPVQREQRSFITPTGKKRHTRPDCEKIKSPTSVIPCSDDTISLCEACQNRDDVAAKAKLKKEKECAAEKSNALEVEAWRLTKAFIEAKTKSRCEASWNRFCTRPLEDVKKIRNLLGAPAGIVFP